MAGRSWGRPVLKSWFDIFKRDARTVGRLVPTAHRYLKLAGECMRHVRTLKVSTSLRFNHGQCEYLVDKLYVAVQTANVWAERNSSELNSECHEIMKSLWRSAREIESFVQGCCKEEWIEAAMVLANMSAYVSSLGHHLEVCTFLLVNRINRVHAALYSTEAVDGIVQYLDALRVRASEDVKERVSRDQRNLLTRLESLIHSSNVNIQGSAELAECLAGRLSQHLSGSVQLSVWEIHHSILERVHRLGSGSAGMVHKSIWLTGQIEVAEKVFYGSDHPSFVNEVNILAGLAHPNITPLLGYATDDSRSSIVMELMDGDLLCLMEERVRERLRENSTWEFPFTTPEAVDIMLQTAEGMLYLHENKVVHGDLKSQNILVKSRKEIDVEYVFIKVADFGLSKTKESSSTYSTQTPNTGTTRWMAPELMTLRPGEVRAKSSDHDRELRYPFKADVYSFGMVCYEILTGKMPFNTTSSLWEVKTMVLNGARPILPDYCPNELQMLIHSCWEEQVTRRPSFAEICKSLRRLKWLPIIVQTAHRYLELARECMVHAQGVFKSLNFNRAQCEYLVDKLNVAVQTADVWAELDSSEFNSEYDQIMKIIWRSAKEIECFVQGCCKEEWIEAAMVLANMSAYVSSLGYNLESCIFLLGDDTKTAGAAPNSTEAQDWLVQQLDVLRVCESEDVKERVSRDQLNLLTRLGFLDHSSNVSVQGSAELAKCLAGRLSQHLSGSVQLSVWEIQHSSLRQVQGLGGGSVGMVYKSIWLTGRIEVAEKVFYGSDHPSFVNEVEILAGLAHPNIAPLLGYATNGSRSSIVMELMDSDLLCLMEERLRENSTWEFPFTTPEAVDIMLQTAEGMLYLHENKVVHGDLKSRDILVKSSKEINVEYVFIKVADFERSKITESSSTYSTQTPNIGTTRWMAPELMTLGPGEVRAKSSDHDRELRYPFKADVYSFGMVCYEILTGKRPFNAASSLWEVKKMVLNGDRPILPDHCPNELQILIHSCWEEEARSRPSFVEICKSLRRLKWLPVAGVKSRSWAVTAPIGK